MKSTPTRWRFAILPLVLIAIVLPRLVANREVLAAAWPLWRSMILDMLLFIAAAIVVAAVIAGAVAWLRAKKEQNTVGWNHR